MLRVSELAASPASLDGSIPEFPVLHRQTDTALQFARDDGQLLFELPRDAFAHITSVCATDSDAEVVVTAAQSPNDVADVTRNNRGRYRAFRVNVDGVTPLTTEYTSSAVPLRDDRGEGHRIAYYSGSSLVVLGPNEHRVFKAGRFTWGPPSLSVDDTGRFVGMTRWKGDDRKLLLADLHSGSAETSKFSYFSYLFHGRHVLFELATSIRSFDLTTQVTKTVTTTAVTKQVLALLGLPPEAATGGYVRFSNLAPSCNGGFFATVLVFKGDRRLGHAVMAFGDAGPSSVVYRVEDDRWLIKAVCSSAKVTGIALERYEDCSVEERRFVALGEAATWVDAGWWPVMTARTPDFGFQFLPS
jgi:hypothetical protein